MHYACNSYRFSVVFGYPNRRTSTVTHENERPKAKQTIKRKQKPH